MPPKFDPEKIHTVMVKAKGGLAPPISAMASKVGPFGISPKAVCQEFREATTKWQGQRVTCRVTIQNRMAKVEVVPSASELIIKALNEPPRELGKEKHRQHKGDLSFDAVIDIAREMRERSRSKKLEGTVKEILGTAHSVGCTVDQRHPHDIVEEIRKKNYLVPLI